MTARNGTARRPRIARRSKAAVALTVGALVAAPALAAVADARGASGILAAAGESVAHTAVAASRATSDGLVHLDGDGNRTVRLGGAAAAAVDVDFNVFGHDGGRGADPVIVPGDVLKPAPVTVVNDGPATGTMRATLVERGATGAEARSFTDRHRHIYLDTTVNGTRVNTQVVTLADVLEADELEIASIDLGQQEQAELGFELRFMQDDLAARDNTGNSAFAGDRLATFTLRLEIRGENPDAPVYDVALRSWISELHRPGVGVISARDSVTVIPGDVGGPAYGVPYVTFDNPDADVQVGDILVSSVRLFNQGNRTVRIDQMVKYMFPGLELTTAAYVDGHDEDDRVLWEIDDATGDGLLTLDQGVVLAPGEHQTIHAYQRVTSALFDVELADEVDEAGRPFRQTRTFSEVAAFSGWVQEEPVPEPSLFGRVASFFAAPFAATADVETESHDGFFGRWVTAVQGGVVDDTDSNPYTRDHVRGAWVDSQLDARLEDPDEDDHDGTTIRVMHVVDEQAGVTPTSPGVTDPPTPAPGPSPNPVTAGVGAETGGQVLSTAGSWWAIGGLVAAAGLLLGFALRRRREDA